jgi:hypothetical protein
VKGKLANGVGSQYSYTASEHGVSSITTADAVTGFSKCLCSLRVGNIVISNITWAFYSTADGTRYSDRLV